MRLVFAGTPEVALPSLQALASSRHDLVGVITRPDAASGRGRRLVPSPVAAAAESLGVAVLRPAHPRDADFQRDLRALDPDCCPVVAYGALVPSSALEIPRHGWVNLHFSVLPAWRGAAPVQHALLAGATTTGATTFRLVPELDAGPVFAVTTETVRPTDTAGDLLGRLADTGAALLVGTLDAIEDGTAEPRSQPTVGVSLAPKLTVEDGYVDFRRPAETVDRRVRACTPAPGAWTKFRGERLKLGPVGLEGLDERGSGLDRRGEAPAPGQLVATKQGVLVGTASAPVWLGEVQAVGRRRMPATDWARGVRVEEGELLGDG